MTALQNHVWELRYQDNGSNKFYRVYEAYLDGKAYVVTNWGRWGAPKGQFGVAEVSEATCASAAIDARDKKTKKGYQQVRQNSLPSLPEAVVDAIRDKVGVRKPAEAATPVPAQAVSVFDTFAMDVEALIVQVVGAPEVTAEVAAARATLTDQLASLRASIEDAEGRLELANDMIAMKLGAS